MTIDCQDIIVISYPVYLLNARIHTGNIYMPTNPLHTYSPEDILSIPGPQPMN